MKRRIQVGGTIGLLTLFTIWSWTSFGPRPVFFQDGTLLPSPVESPSPHEAVWSYYIEWTKAGSDPPKRERASVRTRHVSAKETIVELLMGAEDDSVHLFYHRFTLVPVPNGWRVARVQTAWKGRGRWGWTTRSTS